jgi:hypothetical protein
VFLLWLRPAVVDDTADTYKFKLNLGLARHSEMMRTGQVHHCHAHEKVENEEKYGNDTS